MKTTLALIIASTISFSINSAELDLRQIEYPLADIEGNIIHETITVEVAGSSVYWEGDLLVGFINKLGEIELYGDDHKKEPIQQSQIEAEDIGAFNAVRTGYRWTNGVIPYSIHPDLLPWEGTIRQAMDNIENAGGVHFIPRTNQSNYITIHVDPEEPGRCAATSGMRGGEQFVRLGSNCRSLEVTTHELLHVLGFRHTHSRSDRDQYVQIHWDNISEDRASNFDIVNVNSHQNVGPYDYMSLMHYRSTYFSKNGQPTITRLDNPGRPMRGSSMTDNDKATIVEMYGPAQLTQLVATPLLCHGSAQLTWDAVPAAGYYRVQASSGSSNWMNVSGILTGTSTMVNQGSTTTYRIAVYNQNDKVAGVSNTQTVRYYPVCL